MRPTAQVIRRLVMLARFRIWVARLRFELWRQGGRLELDAPFGAHFESAPFIRAFPAGDGSGVLRLRIGEDVRLGRGMTIEIFARGDNDLSVGNSARFLNGVRLALRSGSIRLGDDCLIRDGAWVKADGQMQIGNGVTIGPYSAIHCTERITLHDLVGLGERVSIIDSDHTFDGSDVHYMLKPISVAPIEIHRQTMIAVGSVLLKGVSIGANSVVAANSVVRGGDYPKAAVVGGNPAKLLRLLTSNQP